LVEIDTPREGTYMVNRTLISAGLPYVALSGEPVSVLEGVSPEDKEEMQEYMFEVGKRLFIFEEDLNRTDIPEMICFINNVTAYARSTQSARRGCP
jgi:hypothetical protein